MEKMNLVNLSNDLEKKVNAYAAIVAANGVLSDVEKAKGEARKALSALNKARMTDAFDALSAHDGNAKVAALATAGTFNARSFKLPGKNDSGVKYSDVPALLSLSGFLSHVGSANVGVKPEWASLVRDAVHLSMLKLAQGLKQDVVSLMNEWDCSGAVRAAVKNGKKNKDGEMSYDVVQNALQTAMDAICFNVGERTDGLNMYRVNRQCCRWLEASFGINKVTGRIIVPEDETMNDRFFMIMRHVIANMPFEFEKKDK